MNDNSNVPSAHVALLGSVVTAANVLVTIIIVVLMIRDQQSATTAALSAVAFFVVSTVSTLLTLSGALTSIVTNAQNQHTARSLHTLQFPAQTSYQVVEPLQIAYTPAAPVPVDAGGSYVPAVATALGDARKEAMLWTMALYGDDGQPNPNKVNLNPKNEKPGRTWTKKPSPDAIRYLTQRGVAHDLGNGMRINLSSCPTVQDARDKLR